MNNELARWIVPATGSAAVVLIVLAFRIGRVFEAITRLEMKVDRLTGLETKVDRLEMTVNQIQKNCKQENEYAE